MVRAGNFTDADRPNDSHVAFSTDGGANWFQGTEPAGVNSGGTVAAAADGSRVRLGAGRRRAAGRPLGRLRQLVDRRPPASRPTRVIESDRVEPEQVLRASRRQVLRQHQRRRHASPPPPPPGCRPTAACTFKAVPGREGDVWLAGGDAGRTGCGTRPTPAPPSPSCPTCTRRTTSASARRPPATTYPALYTVGKVDGVRGVFRSDDAGGDLGADQRRPAPVRQHRRGDHRRPAGLRPGLPRHQRPRHPRTPTG